MKNSLKEKVRYWFEFLKLAHETSDSVVKNQLRESAKFYSAWGNYRQAKFNEWWKTHSSLFRDTDVLSVPKTGEVVTDDAFYVRVPYTYASSTVGKIVADMYDRELSKRSTRSGKMKKVYGGTFRLSREDYQVAQFHYYLVFVRDVYLPTLLNDPKAKPSRYLERGKEVFGKLKRKTTEKRQIPFTNADMTYDSASRLVRRYRQMAGKLLRNVSSGEFPGDYEETFIKNQSQIRAEKAAKAHQIAPKKRLRGRPVSMDQTLLKRESGFNIYEGLKRKTRSDKGVKRGKQSSE
jgi:hypothetical protein